MKKYGTRLHKMMEIFSWVILLISFLIAIYGIFVLPDTIATHYNMRGEVDGYGSPAILLLMPILMGICLMIMSLCVHLVNPENWSTLVEVRRRNREMVYRDSLTMMLLVELELSGMTLFIQILSYRQSMKGLGVGLVIFISAITLTIILLSVRTWKKNKKYHYK